MQALDKANLFTKASKCDFDVYEVEYLGYKISPDGIFMDPKKVNTIIDWIAPSTPTQLRPLLGFANFYRRFIHAYSKLAKPLYELLKKDVPYTWTVDAQAVSTTSNNNSQRVQSSNISRVTYQR